jgi:hypothetical protein
MDDDWRLKIDLDNDGFSGEVADHLRASEIEGELEHDLAGEQIIVSHEGETIYLYAGERAQLDQVSGIVTKFLESKGWKGNFDLRRWHKESKEWEPPSAFDPTTPEEKEAEHERLIERERAETEERGGRAEFEVSAKFSSNKEAHRFAEKLEAEGFAPVRRCHYLIVGAADEDAAKELAERIREEAPTGAEVKAEYSLNELHRQRPSNPFFWLGGLGGD